jgi:hypothetical protein
VTDDDALPTAERTLQPVREARVRCGGACCDSDLGGSWHGRRSSSEELLPERFEQRPTFPTPQAEVTHLVNAVGPYVLKETAEKLVAIEPHRAPSSTISIGILEEHVAVGDVEDAVVVQRPAIE